MKYLVAFFEFEDLAHTKTIEELRRTAVDNVVSYYRQVSYGKITVTAEIVPKWIMLPIKVQHRNIFVWDFNQNDMFYVDSVARNALFTQPGIGASSYDVMFVVYAGRVWGHARSNYDMTYMNEYYTTNVYRHELGHVLGLPDLYSYRLATEGKPSGVWVGPWDLMSWNQGGLSSWSLMKLGWLDKDKIARAGDKMEGTYVIDALGMPTSQLLLLQVHIPGTTQDYYVEVREKVGADAAIVDRYPQLKYGVLVYRVSAQGDPREGQVRLVDAHPGSYTDPELDLLDAPFNIGMDANPAMIDQSKDVSIIVLVRTGNSYKVMLANAQAGNEAVEANDAIARAEAAVSKAQRELRTVGLNAAQEQLVSAKASYESGQFQTAIQTAAVAVETASKAMKPAPQTTTATTSLTSQSLPQEAAQITSPRLNIVYATAAAVLGAAVVVILLLRKRMTRRASI